MSANATAPAPHSFPAAMPLFAAVRKPFLLLACAALILFAVSLPAGLTFGGRAALAAIGLAMLGWIGTRLPESWVALAAVIGLVLSGALPQEKLFAALGTELVWLLLAAFVIAAVLKDSGLTARLIAPLAARQPRFDHFCWLLTVPVAATAFVLPSTSGRAALLLPIFIALREVLPDPRLVRPLALLFPTVILLSAGGSLIGAGAHLLAVEAIASTTGLRLGYLDWALLGVPFALLTSFAGTALILALFVPRELRHARIGALAPVAPNARQTRVGGVILVLLALWLSTPWHGLDMTLVALLGALTLITPPFTERKSKELFRAVDVELLLYMSATVLMAQAMTESGADRWLAAQALAALPASLAGNRVVVIGALAAIAVSAHLFITSRSARAAVLIPALALPLAGLGHDAALLILVAIQGTGFCQTMMASAKPVAIFGNTEDGSFSQRDLFRLALPLLPVVFGLLMVFALWIWPGQLAGLV